MIILILFFIRILAEILNYVIVIYLELITFTFFTAAALVALTYVVTNRKKVKRSYMPLLIQLVTVVILIFIPVTKVIVLIDFWVNLNEREEVVEMIQEGKLTINKSEGNKSFNVILLPEKYRHLSKGGGEVLVINKGSAVCFYTYNGVLDSGSGFMYMKKGNPILIFFNVTFKAAFKKLIN